MGGGSLGEKVKSRCLRVGGHAVQGALGQGHPVLAIENFQWEVSLGFSHMTLSCSRWQVGFHLGCVLTK